jgi:hypothetical protein
MQSRTRAGDSIPSVKNNEVLFEMFCFLTAIKISEILCKLHYCKNYTELVVMTCGRTSKSVNSFSLQKSLNQIY